MEHSRTIFKGNGSERSTGNANCKPERIIEASTNPVLSLQRTVGNRAVQRLIQAGFESSSAMRPGEIVNEVLDAPGEGLDAATRDRMESNFGVDFSGVRIHVDGRAAESARAIHAHAYTSGQDIVFSEGRYEPGTSEGQQLLTHELTHVVQQAAGPVAGTPTEDGSLSISDPDDAFEQVADINAGRVQEHADESGTKQAGDAAGVSVQCEEDGSRNDL